ncbi:MerR family transcriptional regulator [Vagococcus sp. BWB3-3]|uniref:MerR family transcriptional regulator n=1 Tax=Vagococcus allomyrinae TaxID=2794353 RepID=A0A940PAC2_9ENTE|nr:MerR family transcriptional regulator [Vagococcus allomyrinae]MBP1042526.1 MerR family transcriptional regulator [Vagococcus allomyrinae]
MLINEITKQTGLTKKAVEYYCEQQLISPTIQENGYRDFSESDRLLLEKIAVLRKLEISVEEIKEILADQTGDVLQRIALQKKIMLKNSELKQALLNELCLNASYVDIKDKLQSIDDQTAISDKLLELFPGYYGRYICLHFARFLTDPIANEEQQKAYDDIISFLDDVPQLVFPLEIQDFIDEHMITISNQLINKTLQNMETALADPETFMSENKDFLIQYMAYKQSTEYLDSPSYKMQAYMKEFNASSGYYERFIPAMKKLSPAYTEYYAQLERADKKLQEDYPEIANWERN